MYHAPKIYYLRCLLKSSKYRTSYSPELRSLHNTDPPQCDCILSHINAHAGGNLKRRFYSQAQPMRGTKSTRRKMALVPHSVPAACIFERYWAPGVRGSLLYAYGPLPCGRCYGEAPRGQHQERRSVNIETKSRALLYFRQSGQAGATYRDSLPLYLIMMIGFTRSITAFYAHYTKLFQTLHEQILFIFMKDTSF